MRLYTVILVKITNLNASFEEPNTAKRIEGFGFQINTPERVYFFRTPTEELGAQ